MVSPAKPNLISFGVYEFNLYSGELRKKGMRVRLEGQPLAVLQMLVDRSGELVTRDELQKKLWPADTFVDFDHSLNAAIRRLRDALGDSAENPRFVQTVARRGYRFLMPGNGTMANVAPVPQTTSGSRWWRLLGPAAALIIAAVGWVIAYLPHHPPEVKQRRLTANSQDDPVLGSVISPDGKYLVFSDKTSFYLRQIDNGETHPVSLPKGFNAIPAAWYPDGTHLIAAWGAGPNSPSSLWQISIVGGVPRKLIEDGRLASVSRDGSQIAFVRGTNLDEELWVMGGNGEKPRRLLAAPHRCVFGVPTWSPDGRRIAYVSGTYEPAQWGLKTSIATLDVNDGHQEIVVSPSTTNSDIDHNAPQLGPSLAWTSDSHFIYSVSEPTSDDHDSSVWSLPVDLRGHASGPALRLTDAPDNVSNLNASADGKRIVYTKYSSNPTIYISELQSAGTRLSTPKRLTLDDWKDFPFAWAPDSKDVLFVSDRDGPYHIFKQQLDKTVPEALVGGNEQANVPRIAPDNSSLVYVVWPKLGGVVAPSRLMRISLAGGPPQTVLEREGIGNVQCARLPSALCLYHIGTASQLSFFRFDPATGASEELPQLRIEDQDPHAYNWSLSPDGKILATTKGDSVQKDPTIELHSVADGSKVTVIAKTWAGIAGIDFAADGRSLWASAHTNTGKSALLNIQLNGETKIVLESTDMAIRWAIPSPDGKHLAISQARGASNVWMLERF